jgi:hypothetical protein
MIAGRDVLGQTLVRTAQTADISPDDVAAMTKRRLTPRA